MGSLGGLDFGLTLVKCSNLSSRTKHSNLLIRFTEDAKVRVMVSAEEQNCKSLVQSREYLVTWVAADSVNFSEGACVEE